MNKKEYVNQNKAYIFDFDLTLCDSSWTKKYFEQYKGNYLKMYSELGNQDTVIEDTRELLDALFFAGYKIIILSARLENSRQCMIEWFIKHKFYHYKAYDIVLCCNEWADKSIEVPHKVKRNLYTKFIEPKNYKIIMAFDDDERNVNMFKFLGITCCAIHAKGV
jgi:hypothetical protein